MPFTIPCICGWCDRRDGRNDYIGAVANAAAAPSRPGRLPARLEVTATARGELAEDHTRQAGGLAEPTPWRRRAEVSSRFLVACEACAWGIYSGGW